MIKWMKKIEWKKAFMVAFIYTVIATIIRQIEAVLP